MGVDKGNPVPPVCMPRGYGGEAILWKKSLDKYIKSLPDGGNRIQCVEIKLKEPVLVVSVYLPTKTTNDNFETFEDCFDQLHEINQKYGLTHKVLIHNWCDFNEDITKNSNSGRSRTFRKFMEECDLDTQHHGSTFINAQEVSELDYLIWIECRCKKDEEDRQLNTNISDHYPVLMNSNYEIVYSEPILLNTDSNKINSRDQLE